VAEADVAPERAGAAHLGERREGRRVRPTPNNDLRKKTRLCGASLVGGLNG
jgi:hypothetical protein